ncbi:MAG: DUF2634 domain-containing protein [Anaerotignaceae bacterium]
MLPKNDGLIDFVVASEPTKTYALDKENNVIRGYCDQLEAIKQWVYMVLNIERYDWLIYSFNYGCELKELFGKPISYAMPRIKMLIEEALLADSRITAIENMTMEKTGRNVLSVTFTVVSTEGEFEEEVKVNV